MSETPTPGELRAWADKIGTSNIWPRTPLVRDEAAAIARGYADTLEALEASRAREAKMRDGSRPLPADRDTLGRLVREAWVRWAQTQPNPKPSWLAPYDDLSEPDKEADRQIGEAIARWTLIHDSARAALTEGERTS